MNIEVYNNIECMFTLLKNNSHMLHDNTKINSKNMSMKISTTVDREIFVLKIICGLKFHGAKFS